MKWLLMILVVIGVSIITFLIYKKLTLEKKEELVKTVSIVGFIITSVSVVGGVYVYYENITRQNSVSAYGIYQEIIKMNMEDRYTDFLGSGKFPKYSVQDIQSLSEEDKKKYEKYQWFVGSNLYQYESIFALEDPDWEETVKGFIKTHKTYISNNGKDSPYRFPCERYSRKIQDLIKVAIPESNDCPKVSESNNSQK